MAIEILPLWRIQLCTWFYVRDGTPKVFRRYLPPSRRCTVTRFATANGPQSLSVHSAGRRIRAADGVARHQEERLAAKTSASVKGGVRHPAVMAARTGLRCAVRAWLAGDASGVALREVLVDRAEWRCVWRLGFLASSLWCIVRCGGGSLLSYCEFSRRCS